MHPNYLWEKLGPDIQKALQDWDITEIILNPDLTLWVNHKQEGYQAIGPFEEKKALALAHGIAFCTHQFLNSETPYLDATLPFNGERINVTIPPISEKVAFNIRKKNPVILSLLDYEKAGLLSQRQHEILIDQITQKKNILISGDPAAGKTTFANAVLAKIAEIAPEERMLILEQVRELQTSIKNVKHLLTSEKVNMRTLLWIAMRNSPDRILVGEVRDGSALELLKAWNTGCRGGIATIHANHARMAMQRLLDLSSEVTLTLPYQLAAEAIDVIVHLQQKKVTEMISMKAFNAEQKSFQFKTLF